jgi:two-component system, NtrC family, response regulator AtoC
MDWTNHQALENERADVWSKVEDANFVPTVSPAMRSIEEMIVNVAATNFPLLLVGESGSGKEAVALHIHRLSQQSSLPFTKVVCGALTPEFFETLRRDSEDGNGHNGAPHIGTLFLDEIAELALSSQTSLLQSFPDGDAVPQWHILTARIISATSRTPEELDQALEKGELRKDLFYRLNGICLRLPPLRDRKEDIPALVELFLHKNSVLLGRPQPSLNAHALHIMQQYSWPGNIRELENIVKRIVAIGSDSVVSDLGSVETGLNPTNNPVERLSLKETAREASRHAEKELILKVLERTHWNRKRAAQQLQISYKALLYKLRQMGLDGSDAL